MSLYKRSQFLQSAAYLEQLPADQGYEVAFAGRSNAGKSSALNAITGIKSLARTSKTPGRTQLINLFQIDPQHRIVDLPGYGYAKVSHSIKQRWLQTLSQYLEQRHCLCGLILIMDIRHPLMEADCLMLDWAQKSELACHILLTKADKLSYSARLQTLQKVQQHLKNNDFTIQLFSATKKIGVEDARDKLTQWFNL